MTDDQPHCRQLEKSLPSICSDGLAASLHFFSNEAKEVENLQTVLRFKEADYLFHLAGAQNDGIMTETFLCLCIFAGV